MIRSCARGIIDFQKHIRRTKIDGLFSGSRLVNQNVVLQFCLTGYFWVHAVGVSAKISRTEWEWERLGGLWSGKFANTTQTRHLNCLVFMFQIK